MDPSSDPLARWLAVEMTKLRESLVAAPRSLSELVLEARPVARTRGGGEHPFDPGVVRRFAASLTALDRRRLRLPATFFVEHETPDDAYVTDATVVRLLQALGEIPPTQDLREGKLWMGHARARSLAERHPTAFQFVHL